jgi:hypothetical protein
MDRTIRAQPAVRAHVGETLLQIFYPFVN